MKKMLAMSFLALVATTAAYADDMNMNAPGNQTIIANDPVAQAVNPTAPVDSSNMNGTAPIVPGSDVMPGTDNMTGGSAAMPGSDNMSAGASDVMPGTDNMSAGASDVMPGTDNLSDTIPGTTAPMSGSDGMTGSSDTMGVPGQ
jgi:hypothetical protein